MPTTTQLATPWIPFAQADAKPQPESYSLSWALILLCFFLGMLATFRPAKRVSRIKKAKAEIAAGH